MAKVEKVKKVTVSKEVADAVKELLNHPLWGSPEEIMTSHITSGWSSPQRKCLNALSVQDMANILYAGYEVERPVKLPEKITHAMAEELVSTYKYVSRHARLGSYSDGVKDGIEQTLSKLNIEVKGINR